MQKAYLSNSGGRYAAAMGDLESAKTEARNASGFIANVWGFIKVLWYTVSASHEVYDNNGSAPKPPIMMVAPGTPFAVGDLKRMGQDLKNTMKFLNTIESTTGASISGALIGNAISKVKLGGTSIADANYWNNKPDLDWDEMTAVYIRDSIIQGSSTPVSTIASNGNTSRVIVRSDPMREMRFLGNSMLGLAGGMALIGTAASALPTGKIGEAISGIAGKVGGGGGAITVALGIIVVTLLGLGLVLAFVIPALPYTTWTLSLLTYLIVFAEAMIASLFWALAHAWPEGDGVTSSLASKGWMLYLQVMMTPILMLAGFFIGIQLVYIMGWWVDNTLFSTLSYAYSGSSNLPLGIGSSLGIFGAIGMLIVYTGLMLAIVWKSFDMTAELKNWVFEWIGGSPRSMGENQSQQQHIMGAVGGAQKSMSQAASSGANASGLAKNKKRDQAAAAAALEANAEPKEDSKEL